MDNSNSIRIQIGADAQGAQHTINNVHKNIARAATVAGTLNSTLARTPSVISKIADATSAIRNGFRIATLVAGEFAEPFQQAFRLENAATRLAPLVGGIDSARAMAEHLRNEAAKGTMEFEKLSSVAGQLASVFSSTQNIKTWTSAFHNLAAGTGLDVNELVSNFVKAKASGRFEAGFLDMFAQKGINLFPDLEKQTGLTSAALRKLASEGKLAFSEVEAAILAVSTGTGKFANAAAEASDTAGGSIESMVAQWNILQAKFAEPIADAITPLIQDLSNALDTAKPHFSKFGSIVAATFEIVAKLAPIAKMWALGRAAAKLKDMAGPAIASLSQKMNMFNRSTLRAFVSLRKFRSTVVASHGSFGAFAKGLFTLNKGAIATAKTFRIAMPAAFRAAKAAVVSTGIGLAIVGVGEFLAFLYEKLFGVSEAEEQFTESMSEIADATKDLANRFADVSDAKGLETLDKQINQEQQQWQERLDAFEKDTDEYRQLTEAFDTWKLNASRERRAAEERIHAREQKQRFDAYLEERKQMRERALALKKELNELSKAVEMEAAGANQKIKITLQLARVGSIKALETELKFLENANELTEAQATRARELLDAKKQIAVIEKEAESVRAGLREKIQLMEAELQGNEKLLELKEKFHRAELREQFIKAGVPLDQIEEHVQKYIDLEKAIEAKNKAERAEKAKEENDFELAIMQAKINGNEKLARQLERERDLRREIASLVSQGLELEDARVRASAKMHMRAIADGDEHSIAPMKRTVAQKIEETPANLRNAGVAPAVAFPSSCASGGVLTHLAKISETTRGILDHLRSRKQPQNVRFTTVLA